MQKRDLFIIFGAVVAALILLVSQFFFSVIETGAWGLGFSSGSLPTAPISQERLSRYDAYYLGDTDQKVLYLTFDAGYENGCTEKILDILKKYSDMDHRLTQQDIVEILKKIRYHVRKSIF